MRQTLEACKGQTYQVYYALRENLYEQDWKEAPIAKRLGVAAIILSLGSAAYIVGLFTQNAIWGMIG